MLWLSHDWVLLDLWLVLCHPRVSREPMSTDRPTLVTWLRRDPPVQLTGPAGNHQPLCWGLLFAIGVTSTGTGPRVPPHWCPAQPLPHLGTCVPTCRALVGAGWALGLVSVAHDAEQKPGLCPQHSQAQPRQLGLFLRRR